jgi:hypothetical protein
VVTWCWPVSKRRLFDGYLITQRADAPRLEITARTETPRLAGASGRPGFGRQKRRPAFRPRVRFTSGQQLTGHRRIRRKPDDPVLNSVGEEAPERVNPFVATGLVLASTGLWIFNLFLLVSGS